VGGFWNLVVLLLKSAGTEEDRKWIGFSLNARSLQKNNTFLLSGICETTLYVSTLKNYGVFDESEVFPLCVGLCS
jgi:hypothetical protein